MPKLFGNKKPELRTPDAGVWIAPYGGRIMPEWNLTTAIEAYEKNPIVYACVRVIASEMARSTLRLYRETNGEIIEEPSHPALAVLRAPNPYQSAYEFIEGLTTWLELTGEAPVYLNIPGKEPAEVFLLDPRYLDIQPDAKDYVKGYTYHPPTGSEIQLTPAEVILFRDHNPRSQYRGHAPIRSARYVVDSDQFAEEWNRDFFNNSAVPRAVVTSSKELTDTAFNRLKKTWNETFKGRGKNEKTAILEGGADVKILSQTAKDMDFVALGEKNIERICAAFRVPKALLGLNLELNRASAETMAYVFARWTIAPKLRALAEKLNNDYLPLFNTSGGRYFFKFDDPEGASSEQKNLRYQTLSAVGAMAPNEIRKEEGLEPIEGGDSPLVSAGLIPLGSVQALADAGMGDEAEPPKSEPEPEAKSVTKAGRPCRLKGPERELVRGIRDAKLRRIQRRYEGRSRSLFELQKKSVLSKLDKWYANKGVETRAPQVDDLWSSNEAVAVTVKMFDPLNYGTIKGAAVDTLDLITDGKELDYARARFAAKKMTITFAEKISKTTEQSLRAALQEGMSEGEGAIKMAERVKDVFREASTARAVMIGRTETTKAYSMGTMEGMKQGGATKKEWLTAHDGDVRDSHNDCEDEGPIDMSATFSNGCTAPGEGDDPGETINCFLPGTIIEGGIVKAIRSDYAGQAIKLKTKHGQILSVTPNHPVLTPDGFVAAGKLKIGDKLLRHGVEVHRTLEKTEYQEPTAIEDVFDALEASGRAGKLTKHAVTEHDLHGDAQPGNGQVDIVEINRELGLASESTDGEGVSKGKLAGADVGGAGVAGSGPGATSDEGVAGSASGVPGGTALSGGRGFGSLNPLPLQPLRFGASSGLDTKLKKSPNDAGASDRELPGQLLDRHAGAIELDELTDIEIFTHKGKVYDVESVNGWIVAQGLITSNCRCSLLPVVDEPNED